ncbi:AF4/FMR2 family member lilli [Anopheles maculipalpis]|uniref:AF4/FMR2 family member lilli n=1 Tax=Anopheles maculipalpis TaxID=1496333 RepID=UPI002158E95A|nr:AF4/FMR2 family member lilli [Anopheles maculipalpis]
MCGNYEQKQYGMAHGSLAGMIVKSESLTGRAGVAGSSSPSATNTATTTGSTVHNSAKMGSRRIFTPQFKLQVLDSYRNDGDCKGNQRATARKYGIHRRQIQKWLQVETNLRSVVANGGGSSTSSNTNTTSNGAGGTGSSSSGVVSGHGNGVGASSNGNSGSAAMKINLLNHPHHPHLHHPAHHVHHPAHHHLHYQPMHHHHPHHHPGLTGLMQAPSVAAALHYHHQHHLHQQQQQQQQQQPVHPLAFHPIAVPPVQQPVGLDVVRQRVARNGASAAGLLSPVLTHTGATSAAIPVSSCSPLSVASSTGSLSSSSLCSAASPNSMARRSPSSHQLLQLSDAASSGGDSAHQPHHQQSVIFSPVPLLAAASATPSLTNGTTDSHYYGHIRALAATAQAAAAAAAATTAHRYDHPIDLSRPGSQSPAPSAAKTPYEYDRLVKEEQLEGEEEEISVEEVDEQPFERVVEQAWDLSCRRSAAVPTPDRKRSSSAMSGPIVTPDTSRPAKSVKLFKPYLLDEEEPEQKAPKQQQHQRPDSALADDDKDSTRESPAIVDRPMSPAIVGSHRQQQYPIIWSNSSPVAATAAYYELSPPAYLLASPPQTMLTAGAPAGTVVPAGRGWSSPQASPVSGYDSSTSISSVCSGPEEDNASHSSHSSSSHSHHQHGQSEKLRQQAIDSFYHDVACRGDYRAVATKYNINRKYVEKWLQQEQEDDHQHHQHRHHAEVRSPLVV